MNLSVSKCAAALSITLMLTACAGAPGSGGRSLPEVLNYARQHPEHRQANITDCELAINKRPSSFPFQTFFAGFFDVPEESGGQAFCAALVEATISGDFTQAEQDVFRKPTAIRGRGPMGGLLRDLIAAHERLKSQAADNEGTRSLPVASAS
ncbi:hypothetical protein [Pelagibius marinus]|uniref:hypothetical protein n=1 Tax=Pelagibius marinus TaxID=2762760 RepID=UPI0018732DB2|nr:hypothetical protein [Pelagibius marinus]